MAKVTERGGEERKERVRRRVKEVGKNKRERSYEEINVLQVVHMKRNLRN